MRIIVAGSRTFANEKWIDGPQLVRSAVGASRFTTSQIVSGGAAGIDTFAEQYAQDEGLPLVVYEAEWEKHGNAAGPKRNVRMARNADALVAIWDSKSTGTRHMIKTAKEWGLKTYVKVISLSTHRRVHERERRDFAPRLPYYDDDNTKATDTK